MKHISVLIKPASALCNIRCKYCFYADVSSLREVRSFGKMKLDVAKKMIENIFSDLEDGDELTLAFQGGEPTLAGLEYFRQIVSFIKEEKKQISVHYALQTNGILINRSWCEFLKENQFLVGLSIDGPQIFHDMNRVDIQGNGTFHKIINTKELFDEYEIPYNILCVLTNPLAKEAKKVYRFLQEHHIEYVQFIPCLDELEAVNRSSYALTPHRFASFYGQIFKLWLAEYHEGHYRSIKLFDDLMNLFVAGQPTACGILGNCQIQYVIEADGSVYPCDFYVLDEYRLGYIQQQGLKALFEQDCSRKFLQEKCETQALCQTCPYLKACGGGCKRMKDAIYVTADQTFCGYQQVLNLFLPHIDEILALIRKNAILEVK